MHIRQLVFLYALFLVACEEDTTPCGGDPSIGTPCSIGTGACLSAGVIECRSRALACIADEVAPSAEVCNGLDDNCDGSIDNPPGGGVFARPCYPFTNGLPGVGVCTNGTQTCAAGSYGICVDAVGPSSEICDGLDNDCEGAVDDNCSTSSVDVPNIQPMYAPGSRCRPEDVGNRTACIGSDAITVCASQLCDPVTGLAGPCQIQDCAAPML